MSLASKSSAISEKILKYLQNLAASSPQIAFFTFRPFLRAESKDNAISLAYRFMKINAANIIVKLERFVQILNEVKTATKLDTNLLGELSRCLGSIHIPFY